MWRVCQPYAGAVRLCFNVERSSTHALKPEGTTRANAQVRGTNYSRTQLPELTEASGLNNYLAYAALANPQLEAAFNRWKAALEMVTQAHTLPDPRFNYGYFIQEVETRVGPQEQRPGLSQMFPWFGKLKLRSEAAREGTNAALQQYEAAKLKLFDEVKWCYEPGCEGEHHDCPKCCAKLFGTMNRALEVQTYPSKTASVLPQWTPGLRWLPKMSTKPSMKTTVVHAASRRRETGVAAGRRDRGAGQFRGGCGE
jgi:hypothetical protein